jgi:hypothetical protein
MIPESTSLKRVQNLQKEIRPKPQNKTKRPTKTQKKD